MSESFHAHFLRDLDEDALRALRERLDGDCVQLTAGPEIPRDASIEMLIAGRPSEAHLRACGDALRYLVIPWAGLPETTRELMRGQKSIAVHNLHHNAIATAEMAVALLLSAAKVVLPLDRDLRRGDWSHRYQAKNETRLLHGQTALIIGYGSIGRHVARLLRAFGMNILALRRSGGATSPDENGAEIHGPDALGDLLPRAHAIMLCVPLTDETRGLVGEREFQLLPEGAVLVNVARGAVVDEKALYEALASRRLHAAGIDVWYNYPHDEAARTKTFPSRYPIHELDNVVLSPHRGGAVGVAEAETMRWEALAEVINAAARRETIPNRVDVERGY